MVEHTSYSDKWKMSWVVAYLMEFHFGNRPTSNRSLSEAFWSLMGKNVEIKGEMRWTDGEKGVPNHIHRLSKNGVLSIVPSDRESTNAEFSEYAYTYVLGNRGNFEIDEFLGEFPKHLIDREIQKFLAASAQQQELS